MAAQKRRFSVPTLTVLALIALVAGVAVLVALALRVEPIPTAGETPNGVIEPAPEATATSAPSATPTPAATADTAPPFADRALDVSGSTAVRASLGVCGREAPVVEVSTDAGVTWTLATLPESIGQILAVEVVSGDQFDLIALDGAGCTPIALSTYTGGQFWESYTDRLSTATYFNPATPDSVVVAGTSRIAPCDTPLELALAGGGVAMRCAEGITATPTETADWVALTGQVTRAITRQPAGDGVAPFVIAAGVSDASTTSCPGVPVLRYAADASTPDGAVVGCAAATTPSASIALAADETAVWLWSGTQTLVSTDGGATWVTRS